MLSVFFKKRIKYLIFIILVILISHNSGFFHNIYMLLKYSKEQRKTMTYGYCGESSFGFINDINKHFPIKDNFLILNENPNFTFNNSIWFFYKTNKTTSINDIILINNKETLRFLNEDTVKIVFKNKEYGEYRIIKNFDNCFYLKND